MSRREEGQAAVESAIVMPLMVFFTLGIIQLTMMQHAKLMTEYAAFCAARAGIVWNGNNERMRDAATFALLPTYRLRSDNLANLGLAYGYFLVYDGLLKAANFGGSTSPDQVNGFSLKGAIRVDTISPAQPSGGDLWRIKDGLNWKELDFDGPAAYPEIPNVEAKMGKFYDVNAADPSEDLYRKATVLTIRVRYLYEMRIPFANWVIFTAWFASASGAELYGAIDRATVIPGANATNTKGNVLPLAALGVSQGAINNQRGLPTTTKQEMGLLWAASIGPTKTFLIPLSATYSMRMQSNFHRKWLMHDAAEWGE